MSDCKEYEPSTQKTHKYTGKVKRYFELAKRVALQSNFPAYRHGAVLVRGKSVRNSACNKDSFCSFAARFRNKHIQEGRATLHAELGAILGVDRSITEGSTIFVTRIGKKGDYKMSKPCPMCHEAMRHVGVKRVVYSINNEIAGSYKL